MGIHRQNSEGSVNLDKKKTKTTSLFSLTSNLKLPFSSNMKYRQQTTLVSEVSVTLSQLSQISVHHITGIADILKYYVYYSFC